MHDFVIDFEFARINFSTFTKIIVMMDSFSLILFLLTFLSEIQLESSPSAEWLWQSRACQMWVLLVTF